MANGYINNIHINNDSINGGKLSGGTLAHSKVDGDFDSLVADSIVAMELFADYGEFNDLKSDYGEFNKLVVQDIADIKEITSKSVTTDYLFVNEKIKADFIDAEKIDVKKLNAKDLRTRVFSADISTNFKMYTNTLYAGTVYAGSTGLSPSTTYMTRTGFFCDYSGDSDSIAVQGAGLNKGDTIVLRFNGGICTQIKY